MKKLFKNYTYEFDKNEKRLLVNFCKQAMKQMEGDNRFFADVKAFNAIIEKLTAQTEDVKLTKDELNRLTLQLKENIKYLKAKAEKSWFLMKWINKSIYTQYNNILQSHFSE